MCHIRTCKQAHPLRAATAVTTLPRCPVPPAAAADTRGPAHSGHQTGDYDGAGATFANMQICLVVVWMSTQIMSVDV